MATGTIMGSTTAAPRRTARPDEMIGPFKSKGRHFFLKVLFLTLGATNNFRRFKNDCFKIFTAIQAGVFKNRHTIILLHFLKKVIIFIDHFKDSATTGPGT
jgi:hypothetical protein